MTHYSSEIEGPDEHKAQEPAIFIPKYEATEQAQLEYHQLFRAWQEQRSRLEQSFASIIGLLAGILEAKDPGTQAHCSSVARYAINTAIVLKLDIIEQSIVYYAALLHDIGKIGIRDDILNKPGPLTYDEVEHMRMHVRLGYDLLAPIPAFSTVANVVLHHHEWYDGSGYPNGLSGTQIPLASRIISVVDAYSAMTSERSYKKILAGQYARAELRSCSSTQFDGRVVEAFISVLDDETPDCTTEDIDQRRLLPIMVDLPIFQQMYQP